MSMKQAALAAVVFALPLSSPATDFPLKVKKIGPNEAFVCPGRAPNASLTLQKPSKVKQEPKAGSKHVLYGTLRFAKPLAVRLDESLGAGKGYDRLILDLNGNGDLTDDQVFKGKSRSPADMPPDYRMWAFGPIEMPAAKPGAMTPVVHTFVYVRGTAKEWTRGPNRAYIGSLRMKPGCYLEAQVRVDGATETIGIVDGDCNGRFDGKAQMTSYRSGNTDLLSLTPRDAVLRDRDGSGSTEFDICQCESEPYTGRICLGANVYDLSLADDLSSIRLERASGALGDIALSGEANSVVAATLARRISGTQWEPVTVGFADGKARLPEGTYRLHTCVVAAKDQDGAMAMSKAYDRTDKTIEVANGRTAILKCGAPLEMRVEASKQGSETVSINVQIVGANGEKYITHTKGEDLTARIPAPRFKILDSAGKQVASGQLDYG